MRTLSRLERIVLFGLPALVLVVAYVAVCVQAGTPWPWNRVVHEDGMRTLLQTTFYFEHATRELLLDTALAFAVGGAVRHFQPPVAPDAQALRRTRARFAALTLLVLAVILGGTLAGSAADPHQAAGSGWQAILDDLAQYPTRQGAVHAWGAHWRYHLVERFAELMIAFCAAGILALRSGREIATARGIGLFGIALAIFAAGSVAFGLSIEPLRDPTILGHQARELVTHLAVTLPIALGTCVSLALRHASSLPRRVGTRVAWPVYAAGAIGTACTAYVLVAAVATKAHTYGQKSGIAALLFPHFFEHSLGYVFVAALAGWLYLWPVRGARNAAHPGSKPVTR